MFGKIMVALGCNRLQYSSNCVTVDVIIILFLFDWYRAIVGEIDEDLDADINLNDIRAEPLNPVIH